MANAGLMAIPRAVHTVSQGCTHGVPGLYTRCYKGCTWGLSREVSLGYSREVSLGYSRELYINEANLC